MGGNIAITLRLPDGAEYRIERWTNPVPYYITNMRFVRDDMDHVKEYIDPWIDMKSDYEKNKETGQFEVNMTGEYFPSKGLCPSEYGIIVIDMNRKVIIDCNDYTRVGSIFVSPPLPSFIPCNDLKQDADMERVKSFIMDNRVKSFLPVPIMKRNNVNYDDVKHDSGMLMESILSGNLSGIMSMDMKPYIVDRFEMNVKGREKALQRVKELGFVFDDGEMQGWQDAS